MLLKKLVVIYYSRFGGIDIIFKNFKISGVLDCYLSEVICIVIFKNFVEILEYKI